MQQLAGVTHREQHSLSAGSPEWRRLSLAWAGPASLPLQHVQLFIPVSSRKEKALFFSLCGSFPPLCVGASHWEGAVWEGSKTAVFYNVGL